MQSSSPAAALLTALARLVDQEGRPEARRTASALRAGAAALTAVQPPCPMDDAIRRACQLPGALPEAGLLPAAQPLVPWNWWNPVGHRQPGVLSDIKTVATLMGPDAPIRCDDLLFGLFYQQPDSYYALHDHAADETYTILAGSALWTAGDDRRWRHAGEAIHHPGWMPHAFRTGSQGLLAIWRWSGDISPETYRMLPDPEA